MKLKQVSAGVVLALAGLAANAADYDLGADPTTYMPVTIASGATFFDTFSFSLTGTSLVDATAFSFYGIKAGSAWSILDSSDDIVAGVYSLTAVPPANPVMTLAAGAYSFAVTGKANVGGGKYGVSIAVTPVPEPETYAMMLAGLAALGFLARRRQS
jgi:hypothetical protein